MARNAIDSKSALNLNGMQHSYPGVRTNFFYDFSATGKATAWKGASGGGGSRIGDVCQFVGCLVFMAFNSIKLVVCISALPASAPFKIHTYRIYLSIYRANCLIVAFSLPHPARRRAQQAQAATHGLCPLPAGPAAKRRRAQCQRGNAIKGESCSRRQFTVDFLMSCQLQQS